VTVDTSGILVNSAIDPTTLVPYTGAASSIDLGANTLTAATLTSTGAINAPGLATFQDDLTVAGTGTFGNGSATINGNGLSLGCPTGPALCFSITTSGLRVSIDGDGKTTFNNDLTVASGNTIVQALTVSQGATIDTLNLEGIDVHPTISTTTASVGGGLLTAGSCASVTATTTSSISSTTDSVVATPRTYPGDGTTWDAYIGANNTVIVKVCSIITTTPSATVYNVKVIK